MPTKFLSILFFIAIACPTLMGCRDSKLKTFPTRGKVVFADGTPVKVGTIECKSLQHGVQASGTIELDGTFSLTTYVQGDGAVAGSHQCVIVQFIQTENIPNYKPSTLGVVNRKHASYSTSGLHFDVSPTGPNEIVIEVQGVESAGASSQESHGHDSDHAPKP
jgi:ribosomal protein S12